jgi:prevent-host-death family protein
MEPSIPARAGGAWIVTVRMTMHQVKNHLSSVIAAVGETGEEVEITKHGRVVARLVPPHPTGVILGLGVGTTASIPEVEDLRWNDHALADMFGSTGLPG